MKLFQRIFNFFFIRLENCLDQMQNFFYSKKLSKILLFVVAVMTVEDGLQEPNDSVSEEE
jgi:hypothetical protein